MLVPIKNTSDIVRSPKKSIELFLDKDTNILRAVKDNGTIIDFGKLDGSNNNNETPVQPGSKTYTKQDLIKSTIIFG
jgi:hypothetical protein